LHHENCINGGILKTDSIRRTPPLLAVTGRSGAGKTTLLTALLPRLRQAGLRVAAIKQAREGFEVDRRGKDSWRLRQAGAVATIVASGRRWAMIVEEAEGDGRPDLAELLVPLGSAHLDVVLLEGFGHEPVPRIEVRRQAVGAPDLGANDPWLLAVATDRPRDLVATVPVLDLGDAAEIERFVLGWLRAEVAVLAPRAAS
jgi:molybdopterin-guanine dinucleotide biosynthesis protein B